MVDEETTQTQEEQSFKDFDDAFKEFEREPDKVTDGTKKDDDPNKGSNETKDEKKEETKEESKESFDFKSIDLKGKWNDEEIPIVSMLEKALTYTKDNPDDQTAKEIVANIQKAYDYSTKSAEVKAMKKELDERQQLFQVLQTQVLFSELGTPPLEAVLDPLNETDGEIKVKKDANGNETRYIVYNNTDSLLDHKAQERAFATKYTEFVGAKQSTDVQNKQMEADFKKLHPDVDYTSFITEAGNYINPSASKGLIPFPKDTLEVFFKGKNFDKLVKLEVEKAVKETYEKLGKKQEKASESVKSEKTKEPEKEFDDGFDDGVEGFINGTLNI